MQISKDGNSLASQFAPDEFLIQQDDNFTFRMKVRIDNHKCVAKIKNITVDGSPSSAECGFAQYKNKESKVKFQFEASHPNDFAWFSFVAKKGNSSNVEQTQGMVIGDTHEGYILNSEFTKDVKVDALLGVCDKAAFAEHLVVHGLHTNGSKVNIIGSSSLAAFALEKED